MEAKPKPTWREARPGCLIVIVVVVLIAAVLFVIGVVVGPEEGAAADPAPVAEPTSTPLPTATAEPAPSVTEWARFTPEQAQWIDEQMDKYIADELQEDIAFSTSLELRSSVCDAWERVGWDYSAFIESGTAIVTADQLSADDWYIMREIGTTFFGAVQGPNMDAYMESRRAGETSIPPTPTMGRAYCAHVR